jgi:hypothetical protein
MPSVQFLSPNQPGKTLSGALRWLEGEWRTTNIAANFNAVISRGGNTIAAQAPMNCKLVGWTCTMDNLGLVNAAAGAALAIKVIRQPLTGSPTSPVQVGSVLVGESNVSKVADVEIAFSAGELVYVHLQTPAGWTSTTCDPTIKLEFEAT